MSKQLYLLNCIGEWCKIDMKLPKDAIKYSINDDNNIYVSLEDNHYYIYKLED